ncbi:hypothetical protein T440DRAFT_159556 [Plenodomus tracheiphilus IPT5]|uniref:Uncharacterized protein n=1 Tax=Plenodomus tracheiphilus IPT5 TaxID=1408161 RepID=A0A6A7BMI9_9PLEO|nr:hypothetical protein T440DRAFT_159556 [Plenodomus tracheiphilus IPT5]
MRQVLNPSIAAGTKTKICRTRLPTAHGPDNYWPWRNVDGRVGADSPRDYHARVCNITRFSVLLQGTLKLRSHMTGWLQMAKLTASMISCCLLTFCDDVPGPDYFAILDQNSRFVNTQRSSKRNGHHIVGAALSLTAWNMVPDEFCPSPMKCL